ncbi:glycosyltransferase family 4 protein [Stakelama marina]|uniref:Glycosyltransferase family 1 protein n=1 Tax=Stakelama marina TaxID=2826939 RepID=A0A8T4IBH9_9SPHN|nr:glycosyltransferase family 1 protein [Stakelama marina]MBR0552017.1 glycosyltransferase family 1 protein [Stakelama marina]
MQPSDLRVALFSGNYNYTRDGANQALNLLVGHLLSRGAQVRVYSPTVAEPAFEPTGDLVSVPALSLPGGRGEYKLARGLPRRTRDDLARFAPNLIHVSAPDILGHRALSYARKHDLASVASLHTRFETYPRYYRAGFAEPLIEKLLTRFYNRADRVVVPTPSIADLLTSWGVRSPIGYWPRGVDHDRFTPTRRDLDWRRQLGIADDMIAVGFLGRLVLEKGLGAFADVIERLRARGISHRALIVGDGPAREWFAERVPDAAFAGFQRGDALGRAVASMDVMFNPSVTETWGQVTSEAMASGVPVVAARATGAMDLVVDGETGFLIEPGDTQGYADAIARIVSEPGLRDHMGQAAHARAQGYRWDDASQSVLDTYCELMAARAR